MTQYKKIMTSKERLEATLDKLEEKDEFMRQASLIAGLMKEIGTIPTPRQLKIHLDLNARQMRKACEGVRYDNSTYDLFMKEAKRILKREGLILGFGRVEPIPETGNTSE